MFSRIRILAIALLGAAGVSLAAAAEANGSWATFRAKAMGLEGAVEAWITIDLTTPATAINYGTAYAGAIKSLHYTVTADGVIVRRYSMPSTAVGSVSITTHFDLVGTVGPVQSAVSFTILDGIPSPAFSINLTYLGVPPWGSGLPSSTLPVAAIGSVRAALVLYPYNLSVVEVNDERTGLLQEIASLDAQVATLATDVAMLTARADLSDAELGASAAEIRRLEESFSRALKVPPFVIPGNLLSEQVRSIVDGLNSIGTGPKKQLYDFWRTH